MVVILFFFLVKVKYIMGFIRVVWLIYDCMVIFGLLRYIIYNVVDYLIFVNENLCFKLFLFEVRNWFYF